MARESTKLGVPCVVVDCVNHLEARGLGVSVVRLSAHSCSTLYAPRSFALLKATVCDGHFPSTRDSAVSLVRVFLSVQWIRSAFMLPS